MRKLALAVTIGAACLGIAACSQSAETTTDTSASQATEAAETTAATKEETESESTEAESSEGESKTEDSKAESKEETSEGAETESGAKAAEPEMDNFTVDMETVAEMGKDIKAAVEAKDLEALAELTSYPVYVGLEGVKGVETKEDFLALGADAVFTEELTKSVGGADETALEPSEAGFVLSSEDSSANIIFGVVEGELKVTGINY